MADNSVSAIDEKNTNTDNSESQSDWKGFTISVVVNVIVFLVLILIGSNFVFMVHFNALETVFPRDIHNYLPRNQKGGRADLTTYARKSSPNSGGMDLLKSLGYTNKLSGWPYSMYKNADRFTWQEFKNWFALTQANTFITYRKLMHIMYTGDYNEEGTNIAKKIPDPLLYLVGILIPIFASALVIPLMTFISTIFFSFTSEKTGWIYALVGFIFVLLLSYVNIIMHETSLLFNVFLTPMLINFESVLDIAQSNVGWLTVIFGLFVIGSAFANLDNTTSGIMTAAYVVWLIKKYFF